LYKNLNTDAGKSAAEKDVECLEAINEDISTHRPTHRRASTSSVSRRGSANSDIPTNLRQGVKRRKSINGDFFLTDPKVKFGRVSAREYRRCLGTDTVPTEGFWPLGLSKELVRNVELGSVQKIQVAKKDSLCSLYDEKSRKELLLANSASFEKNVASIKKASCTSNLMNKKIMNWASIKKASSTGSLANKKKLSRKHYSEDRQNFFWKLPRKHSSGDLQNLFVLKIELEDLASEMQLLRIERCRTKQGCACKKKSNFMLTKGKFGKMKVLSKCRLKDELKQRGWDDDTCKSRTEMEEILTRLIDQDPCCDEYCPCVKNGIGCHENACSCWKNISGNLDVDKINRSCGNTFGMKVFDVDKICSHRTKILEHFDK